MPSIFCEASAAATPVGHAVVHGQHGVDLVVLLGQDLLHRRLGEVGLPVLDVLLGDDLDLALVDQRLQDLHLAVAGRC